MLGQVSFKNNNTPIRKSLKQLLSGILAPEPVGPRLICVEPGQEICWNLRWFRGSVYDFHLIYANWELRFIWGHISGVLGIGKWWNCSLFFDRSGALTVRFCIYLVRKDLQTLKKHTYQWFYHLCSPLASVNLRILRIPRWKPESRIGQYNP